jgi:mono/diheme cytochrome c family protein/DNA-binding beta-propeller fold protein YncE
MFRLRNSLLPLLALAGMAASCSAAAEESNGAALFKTHCAECHGADRFGRIGPALLPESLARVRKPQANRTVTKGLPATQMPAFDGTLDKEAIAAIVDYIYTPLAEPPRWDMAAIAASLEIPEVQPLPAKLPVFDAEPLNLFVVVESGDHHVTILDGDRFEPITRFKSRLALHGGPKFTADGRYVFFASRDGWISKYDLYALRLVAEIRAGINTRNIAISPDGRSVAVANYLPHTLVLLDGEDLRPLKVIDARDRAGKLSSRVSAVYQAAARNSFVVALKDIPELWEVSYLAEPEPVYPGLVHSHEKGMIEALTRKERFPVRRIELEQPLDDFFFDQKYRNLIGSARDGKHAVVINLNVGRPIKTLPLEGLPHLGSGISWTWHDRRVMATPHLKESAITVLDTTNWEVLKQIKTEGPGFFLRSHENSPYAWADVFFGPNKDAMHVIDKQSLKIVKTLRPAPGKTAAHVEFTRDGRYALVSIWEMDGAIVVYDATTLEEVKRIPMVKPSGKYNVYNKTRLSEGTSH